MVGREPVGAIRRLSDSGSGYEDGPEFIQCADGLEPQINEVLTFGKDDITREVHPTARADVSAGFVGEFSTNFLTPNWHRIPMFRVNSINISVQRLGVPAPLKTDGYP